MAAQTSFPNRSSPSLAIYCSTPSWGLPTDMSWAPIVCRGPLARAAPSQPSPKRCLTRASERPRSRWRSTVTRARPIAYRALRSPGSLEASFTPRARCESDDSEDHAGGPTGKAKEVGGGDGLHQCPGATASDCACPSVPASAIMGARPMGKEASNTPLASDCASPIAQSSTVIGGRTRSGESSNINGTCRMAGGLPL